MQPGYWEQLDLRHGVIRAFTWIPLSQFSRQVYVICLDNVQKDGQLHQGKSSNLNFFFY